MSRNLASKTVLCVSNARCFCWCRREGFFISFMRIRTDHLILRRVLACSLSRPNHRTVAAETSSLANITGLLEALQTFMCTNGTSMHSSVGRWTPESRKLPLDAAQRPSHPWLLKTDSSLASLFSPLATKIFALRGKERTLVHIAYTARDSRCVLIGILKYLLSAGQNQRRVPARQREVA